MAVKVNTGGKQNGSGFKNSVGKHRLEVTLHVLKCTRVPGVAPEAGAAPPGSVRGRARPASTNQAGSQRGARLALPGRLCRAAASAPRLRLEDDPPPPDAAPTPRFAPTARLLLRRAPPLARAGPAARQAGSPVGFPAPASGRAEAASGASAGAKEPRRVSSAGASWGRPAGRRSTAGGASPGSANGLPRPASPQRIARRGGGRGVLEPSPPAAERAMQARRRDGRTDRRAGTRARADLETRRLMWAGN
ncbi:translation initiation factor IF-2 [Rhineura floridana]|uniref:translation initiation factor IF-2 n=1 Tax=Rhineura floridana TaxID=261503 RepID=UPI002AC8178D|nr:translation initiation factor IF-2 [Rhineura floridana]